MPVVLFCRIATGSFDMHVKIWTADGRLIHSLQCRYILMVISYLHVATTVDNKTTCCQYMLCKAQISSLIFSLCVLLRE